MLTVPSERRWRRATSMRKLAASVALSGPGRAMSPDQSSDESLLSRLEAHLRIGGYAQTTSSTYLAQARRFLEYLATHNIAIEATELSDMSRHLCNERQRYRRRHGHPPRSDYSLRSARASSLHMLLRVACGQWPPTVISSTPLEIFQQQICHEYAQWLATCRGLSMGTISGRHDEGKRFLTWLGERCDPVRMYNLSGDVIDAYLTFRVSSLSRRSRKSMASQLRSFVRYLHSTGRITRDLVPFVVAPKLYAFETIPSALRDEEVRAVIETVHQDHSAKGLRDYAIIQLLDIYGLWD
jgi:integrase/recombinase XerD